MGHSRSTDLGVKSWDLRSYSPGIQEKSFGFPELRPPHVLVRWLDQSGQGCPCGCLTSPYSLLSKGQALGLVRLPQSLGVAVLSSGRVWGMRFCPQGTELQFLSSLSPLLSACGWLFKTSPACGGLLENKQGSFLQLRRRRLFLPQVARSSLNGVSPQAPHPERGSQKPPRLCPARPECAPRPEWSAHSSPHQGSVSPRIFLLKTLLLPDPTNRRYKKHKHPINTM